MQTQSTETQQWLWSGFSCDGVLVLEVFRVKVFDSEGEGDKYL